MCRLLRFFAVFVVTSYFNLKIGYAQKTTSELGVLDGNRNINPAQSTRTIKTKPIPTPDLYDTKINEFPAVSYPTNIMEMTKSYSYEPLVPYNLSPKPEFDRSVQPEKLTANLRKKLKNFNNSASDVFDNINKITSTKSTQQSSAYKSNAITNPNTAFSGKFAPKMGTDTNRNYYNSRQWARKLAALSKGSRLSPSNSNALTYSRGTQNTQNATSVCESLWSKDIPVMQVIDNAITTIEKMINNSMLFNSDQNPSISIKEATKILNAVESIQEILKILDCLNGVESSLYYNVKTGVSNKSSSLEELRLLDTNNSTNTESPVSEDSMKNEANNVTVIKIVDNAITIVEDILNSTVLQNIEKNTKNENVILLSEDEAEEIVNVVETTKEILGILEELNGNVNSSSIQIKSNNPDPQKETPSKDTIRSSILKAP